MDIDYDESAATGKGGDVLAMLLNDGRPDGEEKEFADLNLAQVE